MRLGKAEPVVAGLGRALLGGLAATWRFREVGAEHPAALEASRSAYVLALWHSRILPLLFHHRDRGVVLLISRHRDGGHLADLSERLGYGAVRGSTKRGGEAGLLGIIRSLREGNVVAITPDGPRGPAQRVQPGAVVAAQHAGVPLLPITATPSRAWRLSSWDRMRIPKPFARVDVIYGPPISVGPGKDGVRQAMADVERSLTDLSAGG